MINKSSNERRAGEIEALEPFGKAIFGVVEVYLLSDVIDVADKKFSRIRKLEDCYALASASKIETRIATAFGLLAVKLEGESNGDIIGTKMNLARF